MTSESADRQLPVSVVVLALNEERNLGPCLESVVGWAARVFVVDSGSTDATVALARSLGAQIVVHVFETHARQWRWALENLPLDTEWVLGLDADQRLTPELRREIGEWLGKGTGASGAFVKRRQIFRGKWIKHGGYYPKYLLKLFRRDRVSVDADDLVDHHFVVDGAVAKLDGDLIEDNLNESEIAAWTAKHNRYAVLQARQELASRGETVGITALFGSPDLRVRWLKQVWAQLPLFVRPCLYVFYRYVLRFGFLDGKQGFIFHVLQAFWYRLLVDINIDEMRDAPNGAASASADKPAVGAGSGVR